MTKKVPNKFNGHKLAIALVLAGALLLTTFSLVLAFTQSKFISFTLEGCRNDGTITLPILGKFICPDAAYTTGNLGKGWNELDLVPHRLTTSAGNQSGVTTVYDVYIAADYQTSGEIGYDVISVPTVNSAKSDASCSISAGSQLTQGSASSPFGGGTDIVVYRQLTIHQAAGSTCVFDYYQRLALGSHNYPGSSLQSYMFDDVGLSGGKKTISIPVNQIQPQSLSKTMSATQSADYAWNVVKEPTPATLTFGNTCDPNNPTSQSVQLKVTWTRLAATPSAITVITNVYAANPSARTITTSVTDVIYSGTTALDSAYAQKDVPANTANFLMLTHTITVPAGTTNLNDIATGTYTDLVTGIPIPGTTTATASATPQIASTTNASATINDVESITGSGLTFSTDSFTPAIGAFDDDYVAGTATTGPVSWTTSSAQIGNGSVTFDKTVYVAEPSQTSGKLSDTATLTGSSGFTASALASVNVSTDARVSLTINKSVAPALTSGSQTFTFHVKNASNVEVAAPTITFNAGDTSKSVTVSSLPPGSYTVSEDSVASWITDSDQSVTINLPTCSGSVSFSNIHRFSPTISTTPNPSSATVGDILNDSATLSGGYSPTGNIVFNLYGPNDATCAGPAVYNQTVAVSGAGASTSPGFTTVAAGTYRWTADYSGDTYNNAVSSGCQDEQVTVNKATPTLSTSASGPVIVGQAIHDVATLGGGYLATGSITFDVFAPGDITCATPTNVPPAVAVSGAGNYTSGVYTTSAVGVYRWIAHYSGDDNNNAVDTKCNDANESSTVNKATPTLSTSASGPVIVGQAIHDVATLSGGYGLLGGSITFDVFAPGDTNCQTPTNVPPAVAVSGAGNYTSGDYTTSAVGVYRWIAHYSGDVNNNAVDTKCNDANESSTVNKATPTLSTSATESVTVGGNIHDVATLAGGYGTLGGSITFDVFAPGDTECKTPIAVPPSKTVSGASDYTSGDYTTSAVGVYRWIAHYSGDDNNNAVDTNCNDANESSTVNKATPTLSTSATESVTVGGNIHDVATLSGGYGLLGGSITFDVFAPGDTECKTPIAVPPSKMVSGAGDYTSGDYTTSAVGVYRWIAHYSGDANNNAVDTKCNDANESSTVNKATPTLSTSATESVTVGGNIHDEATLSGGYGLLGGSITFDVFAPGDTNCQTPTNVPPAVAVSGAGNYTSGDYTTSAVGVYRWIAHYSGDVNNNAVDTKCNDANEASTVNKASPTFTTQADPTTGTVGVQITVGDTAAISGGFNPSGSVTFTLYSDDQCTVPVTGVSGSGNVSGGSASYSTSWTPTAVGTYYWVASYSGDANNNGFTDTCGADNEQIVIGKASPSITTQASPTEDIVVGTATLVGDDATFSGGYLPTGSVTFSLYGPSVSPNCSGSAVLSGAGTINNGLATYDASWTPSSPGTYYWVASYIGDVNNNSFATDCGDANEQLTVIKASPSIVTTATDATGASTSVSDSATLSGGYIPTGAITFKLYGPSATASCDAANLVFTSSAVAVTDNGTYGPVSFSPTAIGSYYWVASYSGDANNNSISTECGDTGETSTVSPGYAKVIKTLNGVAPTGTQAFTFQLRQGATTTSDGTTLEQVDASLSNSWTINFTTQLVPGNHYQLCEWVFPGWNTNLGPNLFVPNSIIPPALPNPNVNNLTVCTDFVAQAGQTTTFTVDNTPPPGGRALTIGFWKNWASCSNSKGVGQDHMLDLALGIASATTTNPPGGLVVSAQNAGSGWPNYASLWYLVLKGDPTSTEDNILTAPDCVKAVNLLNKMTIDGKTKKASDPLFNMTAQLVGAELNRFMGAGINGATITNINRAVLLDGKYAFNGLTYSPKLTKADTTLANCLAIQLDNYNNNRLVSTCP